MPRTQQRKRSSVALDRGEIEALSAALPVYRFYPVEFCERVIGVSLDVWQVWAANRVAHTYRAMLGLEPVTLDMRRTAVASSTGVGKDMLAACLALWFLVCFENPKIIITGPSEDQLIDVMWPELAKWINHSPLLSELVEWQAESVLHRGNPTNAFISMRTARVKISSGERHAEGLSGIHEENVFLIFDEAPGIEDEVYDALLPTMTAFHNIALAIGNPNRTAGMFFRIWYDEDEAPLWQKARVSSDPWPESFKGGPDFISDRPDEISKEALRRKPLSDPVRQSKLYGRHPIESSDDVIYTFDDVVQAYRRPMWPVAYEDQVQIGVDCARFGKDRTVYFVRRGWNVTDIIEQGKSSGRMIEDTIKALSEREGSITYYLSRPRMTFAAAEREYANLDQLERSRYYPMVVLDLGGGYGRDPHDNLIGDGYTNVVGVNFGEAAWEDDVYVNLATEMWCKTLREYWDLLSFASLMGDPQKKRLLDELRVQLTTRPYDMTKVDDRVRILDKKSLRKKGLSSCDHADAACLSVVVPPSAGVA